ncbi:C4-dicarboxylate TRAP transporter substrate-binding protein [Paracoccus sp. Z330]|uniref:C4-dicarboxylate TRAP transporter substrate-binding protein n=1 Tax=Paracoccus onchidii TaxID=3017813 RepID=A0ABT4ZI26_9RHOB|nr:C4-dicarboxylate TRAP transporter substrate-binding protein [Paracoccus onchidii]MDB6178380.1 C4-dicarboxylate TRAP transporter substrate-binding protein [Paracoccus onchidii]
MKFACIVAGAIAATALAGPALAAPVHIAVGFGPVMDTPYGQGHAEWKRLLEERSDGEMILDLYPSDQLGNGKQMLDQMLLGEQVCFSTDAAPFADTGVPDMGIAQVGFMFRDWDEADRLFASDLWAGLEDQLADKGIKIVARNWRYGARQTLTTTKVEHPADLEGLKIRVPQATVFVKSFEHLGAAATPMALGEVYTSLQQGVIDGLENPLAVIDGGKYQEAAKYLLIDNHMRTVNLMGCSTSLWDSLTPEQQQLLVDTAEEAGVYQNKLVEESDAAVIEKFKSEGVTVTEADYDEFAEAIQPIFQDPAFSNWTPGLHDEVLRIIGRE